MATALSEAGLRPPERLFLRYPNELSGGQKQRVLIAGALALRPQLLVADEPVSSLDASIRGEILALLLKLREEFGVGVVVVTHDLGLAWNIADRIAVMYLGRVVESGTTEQVLESPRHPYTQALLSVVPEIEHVEPVVLQGEIPDPTRIPGGCRFHPRCPKLADGSAQNAGVDEQCIGEPLQVIPATNEHLVACHLDARSQSECAMTPEEVVRANFDAYQRQDRSACEALLGEELVFTSPAGRPHRPRSLPRALLPTADRFSRQELIHVVRADDSDVVILYEYELKTGGTFRNTEVITVVDGRIVEIQVFFGGAVG